MPTHSELAEEATAEGCHTLTLFGSSSIALSASMMARPYASSLMFACDKD